MRTTLTLLGTTLLALAFSTSAMAAAPAELYVQKCAGCHGKDGKGQTTMGKKLGMKDLTDPKVQAAAKDADWEKVIADGEKDASGKVVMPASKSKLSPEEIKGLVKVCRDFKGK
jgi:mono/diheme cytochrome c family protein